MEMSVKSIAKSLLLAFCCLMPLSTCAETVKIGSAIELKAFCERVYKESDLDAELTKNIDMSSVKTDPIGNRNKPYSGNFSGNGYVIENLIITGGGYVGLFGSTKNAIITNVHLRNATISSTASTWGYVGGICGCMDGGKIEHCSFEGNIDATDDPANDGVGGICGYSKGGSIYSCANYGIINATNRKLVGGICGGLEGSTSIKCCFNSGNVKGKSNVGAISGNKPKTASDNYYLDTSATDGFPADKNSCKSATSDQVTNGEIAQILSKLDNVWGQNIPTDKTPMLNASSVYSIEYTVVEGEGTVEGADGYCNSPVTLIAKPANDYIFDKWGEYEDATGTLTINELNKDITNKVSVYFAKGLQGTLYNGSATGETIKLNPSKEFVPKENEILVINNAGVKGANVVSKGKCDRFIVRDGYPFYTPTSFDAKVVEYDRVLQNWSVYTFCLPFSIDLKDIDARVYEMEKIQDDGFYFKSVDNPTVANKPYLVCTKGQGGKLIPNGTTNTRIEAGGCSGNKQNDVTHFGTYTQKKFTTESTGATYYAIKQGKMTRANDGVTITSNPFRTVFEMSATKKGKPLYPLMLDGEVGYAPVVDNEDEPLVGNVYDIKGRLLLQNVDWVTALNSGLPDGIFILNGSKIVVREGHATTGLKLAKKQQADFVSE